MTTFKFALCAAWLALALSMVSAAEPQLGSAEFHPTPDHPFGFRGDGSGQFPGATPLTEWSEKPAKNIRWSTPVGTSFSSPILTETDVLVTSEPNLLLCLDRNTGSVRWKVEIQSSALTDAKQRKIADEYEAPKDGAGIMAATPLTDGRSIYVVLANGIVQALDLNGKPLWTAFIGAEQITGYGRSASPILSGGKLIVSMTHLYAFDPATGQQAWMNAEAPSVYGSPTALKLNDVDLIATPAGEIVRASDGKLLSSGIGTALHTTPVASNGTLYFAERTLNAFKLSPPAKGTEIWNAAITVDVYSSPILHDGVLFTVTGKGELFAFDQNGKGELTPIIDARKIFGETQANSPVAYSSLTRAGKYLFYISNAGETVVLEATREAGQIAKNSMLSGCGASPVFSGNEIYIRTQDKLNCIGPPK